MTIAREEVALAIAESFYADLGLASVLSSDVPDHVVEATWETARACCMAGEDEDTALDRAVLDVTWMPSLELVEHNRQALADLFRQRKARQPPPQLIDRETAYGSTTTLSFQIKVF
jgi:hypothetical protein